MKVDNIRIIFLDPLDKLSSCSFTAKTAFVEQSCPYPVKLDIKIRADPDRILFILIRNFFSAVCNLYGMTLFCQRISKISAYSACAADTADTVYH